MEEKLTPAALAAKEYFEKHGTAITKLELMAALDEVGLEAEEEIERSLGYDLHIIYAGLTADEDGYMVIE